MRFYISRFGWLLLGLLTLAILVVIVKWPSGSEPVVLDETIVVESEEVTENPDPAVIIQEIGVPIEEFVACKAECDPPDTKGVEVVDEPTSAVSDITGPVTTAVSEEDWTQSPTLECLKETDPVVWFDLRY